MSEKNDEAHPASISSRWKEDGCNVWRILTDRHVLIRLIAVRLLYAGMAGAILVPMSAWVIQLITKSGGDTVISNFDMANFFLSPSGLIFLVLTGTFTFAIFFFDQSGMILVVRSALAGGRLPGLMEVLWEQKMHFPRLLKMGLCYFFAGLVLGLPVLIVGGICYLKLLSDRDINYYVSVKPPEFWKAVVITSMAAIPTFLGLLWIYLRWFMAVPIVLFEGLEIRESIRKSSRRSAGRAWLFGMEMLGVALLGLFLLLGLSFLLSGLDKLFFEYFANQIHMVVVGGALILISHFLLSNVITFVIIAAQGILISCHYRETAPDEEELTDDGDPDHVMGFFGLNSARSFLWAGLIVLIVTSIFLGWTLVEEVKVDRRVEVTAHRGSSVDAPENTLSALRLAIEEGADYAEIDIQINADHELVMIHDSELKRVSGMDLKVADMTQEQRLKLDVGSWFSEEFADEPLPTLEEVIDLVRGGMKLNIELKFGPNREGLNRGVADLIAAKKYENECVVTSLDYPGLKAFKDMAPKVRTGLIVTSAVGDITRAEADFLSLNAGQVSRSMLSAAEAQGKEVHVWTVNDPAQMHLMIDLGVDNILTDTPKILVDILGQREELSNTERVILQLRSRLGN